MVVFFEVITFFGLAAFFAWLEFLTLLNDLIPHIAASKKPVARRNLVGINDFFLMAFSSFAISVIANYCYHNSFFLGSYYFGDFYHSPIIYGMFMSFFFVGLITFCIPIWYIRRILKGQRDLTATTHTVADALGLIFITTMMGFMNWVGYVFLVFPYSTVFWFLVACFTVWGLIRTIKKQGFAEILLFLPIEAFLGYIFVVVGAQLIYWLYLHG